ncbi:MAG: MBL fold metallo-hydrolase [Actinomycetota bacterium]|nr:MBL fold metallo-hydrolase [Actinomycetota bacterium]
MRGGFPARIMNVYLIQDGGGVTVFDAGIAAMADAVATAGAELGGIKRVVLGHPDADHRGRLRAWGRRSSATRPTAPPPSHPRPFAITGASTSSAGPPTW